MLRYAAFDLPCSESKIQRLTSNVIELEWKKKRSRDEIAILSSKVLELKKSD
jgi:hypothetical protein